MNTIEAFKCVVCGKICTTDRNALECEFRHAQIELANCLLRDGLTLENIKFCCGFHWNLTDDQKQITKYNCFIVSHWQCCDKPAYRITRIDGDVGVTLCGCGGWTGYYSNQMQISRLPKPYPAEDLFIDERYTKGR